MMKIHIEKEKSFHIQKSPQLFSSSGFFVEIKLLFIFIFLTLEYTITSKFKCRIN